MAAKWDSPPLRLGLWVAATEVEGPGRRFALWVQGCPLRCRSCCNPQLLSFSGGQVLAVEEVLEHIAATPGLEGISLLGGEPLAQADPLATLAEAVQSLGLTVMVYSGYTLGQIRTWRDPAAMRLLAATDLLVDGPYDRSLPEERRRWIGSRNQVLHFLSPRYSPADPRFWQANGVEIRLVNGTLTINGFPWGRGLP
ncbi:MAG: 4Fe-4S single cluster domain-containing protein [Candidatus Competibacterales bacterium]